MNTTMTRFLSYLFVSISSTGVLSASCLSDGSAHASNSERGADSSMAGDAKSGAAQGTDAPETRVSGQDPAVADSQGAAAIELVPPLGPGEFEVLPQALAWSDFTSKHFDLSWCVPDAPRLAGQGFVANLQRLLDERFEPVALPAIPWRAGSSGVDQDASEVAMKSAGDSRLAAPPKTARSFGDVAAAAFAVPRAERRAWLDSLPAIPALAPWPNALTELCDERTLFGDWDPDDDDAADGMWPAPAWDASDQGGVWKGIDLQQSAALFRSDLAAIKAAENDYRQYPRNVAANYEEIYPLAGSHLRGVETGTNPFSVLQVTFTSDLPFPFSDYTTDLRVFNRVAADGALITYIHSPSKDFNHMAGRDVFLPVTTTQGAYVGLLLARQFSFDLDNVPDGASDVRAGLRAALGNLKRNAEDLFAAHDRPLANDAQALTEFRLLGKR
jgi:hypothetical protein